MFMLMGNYVGEPYALVSNFGYFDPLTEIIGSVWAVNFCMMSTRNEQMENVGTMDSTQISGPVGRV